MIKNIFKTAIYMMLMMSFSYSTKADECATQEPSYSQFANGLVLRKKMDEQLEKIISSEKSQGRLPKIFIIARAGQDFSTLLTLKDDKNGQPVSLQDIFNDISPAAYMRDNGQLDLGRIHNALRFNYEDKNRRLVYSHIGLLVLNHPATNGPVQMDGSTLDGGKYWVEELLKPCGSLTPRAWTTGLADFYQDDPHEYKSMIMVPDQNVQDALYDMLFVRKLQNAFLAQNYNVAATFKRTSDENSNQYVLELLAAAQANLHSPAQSIRQDAIKVLKSNGYRPTKLMADGLMTGFATSRFAPNSVNIRNDEHPYARPFNVIEVVTELSVREYLLRTGTISPHRIFEVQLESSEYTPEDPK